MSVGPGGDRMARWLAIVASVVVVATVVTAIGVMGTPSVQRQISLDQRRVQDLERIVHVANLYARSHDALPPDLATLARQPGQRLAISDPADGTPYAYAVIGARRFRLCAVFVTDTAKEPGGSGVADEWNHATGRQCFEREARNPANAP